MFADPPLAAADIQRKVDFQKRQFEKKLIELGYDALRDDSTSIITAYARTLQNASQEIRSQQAFTKFKQTCLFAFNPRDGASKILYRLC